MYTKLIKHILFPFFCLAFSLGMKAQFVNYGTDASYLKWRVAKTKHYKLIYPQANDSMAYRYAQLLEASYPHLEKTIGSSKTKSFPVILHPENMLSNGLVAWAPRRMELITNPSPGLYAQAWDRQLVLHESRHVLQTNKLLQGVFKPLNFLLGEQTMGIAAFAMPKWFFEGDAVCAETAMSSSGRGRLPEFSMAYRTQMISGKFYTFDKWAFGSYNDYTGDYYSLGYQLTAFARLEYGADIWNKVSSRYTRKIYSLPPFSNALKHYTGLNTSGLFDQTFSFLKQEWQRQDSIYMQSEFAQATRLISPASKEYTSYLHSQVLSDSSLIAVRSSLSDLKSLVIIKDGKEQRLTYLGNINSRIISNNGRIYWSEYVPGMRWTHKNYSEVKYYNLQTKKIVSLTNGQRYLAPAIDKEGRILAVSEFSSKGGVQIVIIDIESGDILNRYDVPKNAFVKDMTFADDSNLIIVAVGDEGISLFRLNTQWGSWRELLKPSSANITSPSWGNGGLYFESGLDGTNNIYSLDTLSLQACKLTNARFGAFSPSISANKKEMVFSDYQANGCRLVSMPLDSIREESVDFSDPYRFPLAESIAQQEDFNLDTVNLQTIDFHSKPYRKALNLFNVHSWAPFYYDASDAVNAKADDLQTIVKPGLMLLSQNALNTAITQAAWYYDNGYNHGKLAFTYMGFYPIVNFSLDYGGKAFDIAWKQNSTGQDIPFYRESDRNLLEAEVNIYVPFNFTKNHYIRGFQPSLSYNYTNNKYQEYQSREFRDFQYLLSDLRYYHYRKLAPQDILPRWGYQVRLQHLTTPFNTENYGNLYAARFTSYLPGLLRNNGLMLRMAYQYQQMDGKALYVPIRIIDQPRGHNYIYQSREQLAFKADYSFGVFSPDFSLGTLAYVKRMRSNIFYDISINKSFKESKWTGQSSYGADLIFDCNLMRFSYPLSLGLRIIKPIEYGDIQAQTIFSVSF